MRALIHGDDKSSWRSPAVQSLDNETDVMRFGRVFFRVQTILGDLVQIFFISRTLFFRDLVRKELRSIAIGWAALHCHCFDSPPRAFPIVRSSTQIWPGFKAALGGAENINDGFGWTSWCYHHGRQRLWIRERPKPDGNSEEGPLLSLHHLAAKKKRRLTNGRVWKT